MGEILYDMVHRSWYGTIALIVGGLPLLYYALFWGLVCFWKFYNKKYDLRRLKEFLARNWKIKTIFFRISVILWIICIVMFVLFLFKDWRVEHKKYNYIPTKMAEQKSLDVLFINEIQIDVDEIRDLHETQTELKKNEIMQKLHAVAESPMTKITEEEIKNRIDIFAARYRVETKATDINIDLDIGTEEEIKIELKQNSKKSETFLKYWEEYEDWSESFTNNDLSSDLYQMSRAARDMLEVGRLECDDEELLEIAAEAVYGSEIFLERGDWNVNTRDNPVIIETKDVLFHNGKVFYQLYSEAETREELKQYRNEFIVNAYVCMFLAGEIITENDIEYAKVNYYIGNIREKMMSAIPTEDLFYRDNINEALCHYRIALDSLENRPDYYDKENNMKENCQAGINTLNNS